MYGRRNSRDGELNKLQRLLQELAAFHGQPPDEEPLERWFFRWQSQNDPGPFWSANGVMELCGLALDLGEPGQLKRLELVWDVPEACPALKVELGPARELRFLFRWEAPLEFNELGEAITNGVPQLKLERVEYDALAPLNPVTGLLNMGINRRIHRKIDSRALRTDLVRRAYERIKGEGLATHPTKMKRNDFFRALRELAELDERYAGFKGLLREHKLEDLVAEAYASQPEDELTPQLCLPIYETYLPEIQLSEPEPIQIRPGIVPTGRSRSSILSDLELWILLQQARSLAEPNWSAPLPPEARHQDPANPENHLVECPLREPLPCRRGDILVVQDSTGARVGKLLVSSVTQDELKGRLRFETEPPGAGEALNVVPIRSSYGKIARALEDIRQSVALRRDIAMSPALRVALGLEPLPVHLLDEALLRCRLRARGIAEDPSQTQALRWALEPRSPLVLIQGPPGTGKTTLIEEMCRQAVASGLKVAVTAPSHPAVDNVLRRLVDLPLLRVASTEENISEPLRPYWTRSHGAERRFRHEAQRTGGFIMGGTHIGLLNDPSVVQMSRSGHRFDLLIVDEAGMSRPEEILLSLDLAERGVLIGDQQQLPPFPLSNVELSGLQELLGRPVLRRDKALIEQSALELLVEERCFPSVLLTRNYRCHNPRLVELSSQLFYDSRIRLAPCSEYFRLPLLERQQHLGADSLRLFDTSAIDLALRGERLEWEGGAPGYCSPLEAAILLAEVQRLLEEFRPEELCIISPYRKQVHLLRQAIEAATLHGMLGLPQGTDLERFLSENVTTIDSFQGRECDALLVSYVRSNRNRSSGFVGDPRRNNVTHTRARREMVIVGDMETLTSQGVTAPQEPLAQRSAYVFRRMLEIVKSHGALIPLISESRYRDWLELVWQCVQNSVHQLQPVAS